MRNRKATVASLAAVAGLIGWTAEARAAETTPALAPLPSAAKAPVAPKTPAVGISAELPLLSAYVWRGQMRSDGTVVQPNATYLKNGFAFGAWCNYNFDDKMSKEMLHRVSETDLSLSYRRTVSPVRFVGPVELEGGLTQYLFADQPSAAPYAARSGLDTAELFLRAGLPAVPLSPTLMVYRDIGNVHGVYASLSVSRRFRLTDKISLALAASQGYADHKYNDAYFGADEQGLNDGTLAARLPIRVNDALTITPLLQYSWFWDDHINDAARDLYKDDNAVWGGVAVNYTF